MVRDLAQIALLLYQILTGQISLAQAFYKLAGELEFTSKEHSEYAIESNVKPTYQIVNDGAFGNHALKVALDALLTAVAGVDAPILAAIAALPAGSSIVIPSGDQNAAAVWAYQGPWSDQFGNQLDWLTGNYSRDAAHQTFLCAGAPWFACYDPHARVD